MPHRCTGCQTLFPDARYLRDGCPVCGCGKFIFENDKRNREDDKKTHDHPPVSAQKIQSQPAGPVKDEPAEQDPGSIESIRILEPGRYDLNLSRLAESDDRVVRVGTGDTYRLDLHSMIRKKKKR
ncbi:MAG TPA: Zn-ribbon containing protein [Methanospirillum sp.]|jgi:hypothetical protein|uniref:Zn-ribbon domain-containing protein n=1 Tax=Methanospirillum sp. TaxID=45200 RepID=UPI001BD39ECD|nr:Zn-ribbon containing protein [Methanospirillum sp.]HPY60983.1 Zn-ribbon containing protein [Methanospirillum sp.]HQC00076.1 Zn-ribbon containing protein [Methanospirillum sp.]